MKRFFNILTLALPVAVLMLSSCNDDVVNNENTQSDERNVIKIGGMLTDELEISIEQTRADEPERIKAETVQWLKGALRDGLDITYSNMTEDGHVVANEQVAILKWTGDRNETEDIGIYTFKYKKDSNEDAIWYDNGKHYFEGQYVPKEIREKAASGGNSAQNVTATDLTTDQHSDEDYDYSDTTPTGSIGNYTLLSHYIGMPPNWTASATVDQILLPFKHRLARVIAYVLIDDELKAKLEGYTQKAVDGEGNITAKDDPQTTSFRFCNVKVLEKVKESDITVGGASTASLTPEWTVARKAIPHFLNEFNSSLNAKEELVANDTEAQSKFIVYTRVRDNKSIHPRDGQTWIDAHNAFRSAAGASGTDAVDPEKISTAEKNSGYARKMYSRVPIYDLIVRPTYKSENMVMYDERGYYNADKSLNETNIRNIAKEGNSIEFELTLSTGLIYKKKFEFDLNANQQTVVYLTVDREGINYDDSASELWIANNTTDGYYGIDNQLGHNLSKAGSSWQRAVRFGTAPVNNVTDGNFYQDEATGDVTGQYFTTATKWVEEFAKAYQSGPRHGDYFILDKDITIDATLLPKDFVFTGHLDGRGHTITLKNTTGQTAYKPAENLEGLYKKTSTGFSAYTIPTLYTRVWEEEVKYTQEEATAYNNEHSLSEGDDGYKTTADIKTPAHWEYSQKTISSLIELQTMELYTDDSGSQFICPALYQVSHTTDATLFKGLNALYITKQETNPSTTEPWEANVHMEYNTSSGKYFWVPEIGYRAELLNVKLSGGTFFPADAVFTGTELNKSGATVSGYIFNCWEIISVDKKKEISNEVPIPALTPIS